MPAFEEGFATGGFPPATLLRVSPRGRTQHRVELAAGLLSEPGGIAADRNEIDVTDGVLADGRLPRVEAEAGRAAGRPRRPARSVGLRDVVGVRPAAGRSPGGGPHRVVAAPGVTSGCYGRMSMSRSHSSSGTRRPLAAITMLGTRPSRNAIVWPARPTAQRAVPSTFHQWKRSSWNVPPADS